MAELSDEILMSYADGMLDPAERARVSAALAMDAEATRRLRMFEETRVILQRGYGPVAEAVAPRHLAELVRGFPLRWDGAQGREAGFGRSGILEALREIVRPRGIGWAGALAYSFAFLAGAGATFYIVGRGQSLLMTAMPDGRVGASGALASALESALSSTPGDAIGDDRPGRVGVTLTFKTAQGWCRQYTMVTAPSTGFSGVACRDSDGRWLVHAHFPTKLRRGAAEGTVIAGAPEEIQSLVERISIEESLDRRQEAERISKNWRD